MRRASCRDGDANPLIFGPRPAKRLAASVHSRACRRLNERSMTQAARTDNLADVLSRHVRDGGADIAIMHGEGEISYAALEVWVDHVAARLVALGVKPGQAVGICLQDRPAHLAAIYAVLRAGCVVLPMDWRWTPVEQARTAERHRVAAVFFEPNRPRPANIRAVVFDHHWELAAVGSASAARVASPSGAAPGDCGPSPKTGDEIANSPAILGLSSGTTGEPVSVVITHAQYQARIDSFARSCRLEQADRYCSALPLAFSAGRLFAMLCLSRGGTVQLVPTMASPAEIARCIVAFRSTTTCLVPNVTRAMLAVATGEAPLLPALRVLMSIGAPLHAADREKIRALISPNLVDIYASSGGSLATVIDPAEQIRFPDSVGRPAHGVVLQIVDEQDVVLLTDEIGRVRYRGAGMPLGMFEAGANAADLRDGWCYPGDFGSINAENYLFLRGRRSEIVIRGGINVYTPEIERVLLAHPTVREAAVVGVAAADGDEQVVAFVCADPPDLPGLLAHCRGLLAAYKIPARFHFVDSLPKTSAGKVLKRALVEPA